MLIFQGASQLVHLFFCSKNHVSSSLQLHPTHLFSMYRSDHCLRSEALKSTRVGEEAMVTEKRGWKFGDGHQFPKLKEGLFVFFWDLKGKQLVLFLTPASGPGNALGRHLSRAGHGTSGFAKTNKDLATFAGVPSRKTNMAMENHSLGNTSSNGPFSIAMLVYWRVHVLEGMDGEKCLAGNVEIGCIRDVGCRKL